VGISQKVGEIADNLQQGVKNTTNSAAVLFIRSLTGFVLGLVFALIGQEIFQYGTLLFVFVLLVSLAVIFKLTSSWSLGRLLIFDLICVLIGLILRSLLGSFRKILIIAILTVRIRKKLVISVMLNLT
jgi:hypothetical protein